MAIRPLSRQRHDTDLDGPAHLDAEAKMSRAQQTGPRVSSAWILSGADSAHILTVTIGSFSHLSEPLFSQF